MNVNINPVVMFPNAVIILKSMPVKLKGAVYSDSERINDQSTIKFINKDARINLKLGQVEYLIIKIPNENRYNVFYQNHSYSVYPNEQLYNTIDSLFINAIS